MCDGHGSGGLSGLECVSGQRGGAAGASQEAGRQTAGQTRCKAGGQEAGGARNAAPADAAGGDRQGRSEHPRTSPGCGRSRSIVWWRPTTPNTRCSPTCPPAMKSSSAAPTWRSRARSPRSRKRGTSWHRGTAQKRARLIDQLLNSPGYASHFYNYWTDVLRVTERLANNVPGRPYAEWIKVCLETNKPYDKMVYEMLTAEGKIFENPAAGYILRDSGMPLDAMNNTVRIFLGTQIGCAQCHDHPFDRWKQKEFYQMAAFTAGTQTRRGGTRSQDGQERRRLPARGFEEGRHELRRRRQVQPLPARQPDGSLGQQEQAASCRTIMTTTTASRGTSSRPKPFSIRPPSSVRASRRASLSPAGSRRRRIRGSPRRSPTGCGRRSSASGRSSRSTI